MVSDLAALLDSANPTVPSHLEEPQSPVWSSSVWTTSPPTARSPGPQHTSSERPTLSLMRSGKLPTMLVLHLNVGLFLLLVTAPASNKPWPLTKKGSPTLDDRSRSIEHHQALASPSAALAVNTEQPDDASSTEQDQAYRTAQPTDSAAQHEEPEDDGFGDDFDDFEEGAEADQDDDFGDFDDGFREPEAVPIASPVTADAMQDPLAHLVSRSIAQECQSSHSLTIDSRI